MALVWGRYSQHVPRPERASFWLVGGAMRQVVHLLFPKDSQKDEGADVGDSDHREVGKVAEERADPREPEDHKQCGGERNKNPLHSGLFTVMEAVMPGRTRVREFDCKAPDGDVLRKVVESVFVREKLRGRDKKHQKC